MKFAHTPETCPSKHWNRGDDICADCGADLNGPIEPEKPAKVWIVEGEHYSNPGRVLKVFGTKERAEDEAVSLVNIMLSDMGNKKRATRETWVAIEAGLEDYHGAAHCYVIVNEYPIA